MDTMNRPHILLIMLDTLRADRLSCYGHPQATTPHLDAFAEKSVRFERAVSPGQWTIPAHASIFTGTYPSTHMTHQIYDKHTPALPTLAEHLQRVGYRTVGFCNNPLLGVVENDLDRGFEAFYNYGGAFPQRPPEGIQRSNWLTKIADLLKRWLHHLNRPAQNLLTHNEFVLNLMLHPWLVSLWEERIHFKGNTRRSLDDMRAYLRTHTGRGERPLFVYLNLMQTHLPYDPPLPFVQKFAPSYQEAPEARDFMRTYNRQTYRWITPIVEPFTPLQHRVLNELYNAELAYEDQLLAPLLGDLDDPQVRENTLVIITSDHGEGLDHHGFVGHALVTYEDLVHVPLMLRYPPQYPAGATVTAPVSTRRLFHTVLDAAQITSLGPDDAAGDEDSAPGTIADLSLARAAHGAEQDIVLAEAYPPLTMLTLMEQRNPDAIDTFRCRAVRRAIYAPQEPAAYKLITVDDQPEELFDLAADPGELHNLLAEYPEWGKRLEDLLTAGVTQAEARRPALASQPRRARLKNKKLADRLRGLGYIR